jgi:hypothetical protein
VLGITGFLDKRACSAVGHENEGTGPRFLFVGVGIDAAGGVAGGGVYFGRVA